MFIVVFCEALCSSEQNPEISASLRFSPATWVWMIWEMRSSVRLARRSTTSSVQ